MTGLSSSTALPVDQALLPASVRNGTPERKKQYEAALSFERVLVGQLTEQLMKGSSMGNDEDAPAAVKVMKEGLPGTLADSLMAAGGLGLAQQFDAAWHPEAQTKKTSLSDAAPAATDVSVGPEGGATA